MTVDELATQLIAGKINYNDFKSQFESMSFSVPKPTKGSWGKVWDRGENGPDDNDAPAAIYRAETAEAITEGQREELLKIYKGKVGSSV